MDRQQLRILRTVLEVRVACNGSMKEICSPMWRGDAVRKDLPLQETAELVWRMRKLTCKRMGRAIPGRKQNDIFEGLPAIH